DAIAASKLCALARILEQLDLHAVGVGYPGLVRVVASVLLRRDLDAHRSDMGDRGVDVFHLQAEVVDLVALAVAGLAVFEHLDMAAAAAIEVEAEYLAVTQEIEPGVHAEHVAVEAARRLQV